MPSLYCYVAHCDRLLGPIKLEGSNGTPLLKDIIKEKAGHHLAGVLAVDLILYYVKTSINIFTDLDEAAVASLFPGGQPSDTKLEELQRPYMFSQLRLTEDELHFVVCVPKDNSSEELFQQGPSRKRARLDNNSPEMLSNNGADAVETGDNSNNEDDPKCDILPGDPFLDLSSPMLVRAEYLRVFDAVQVLHEKAPKKQLAVVTGQPGIGKTVWIIYALCRCLGQKQPVVCYRDESFFLLSESGVKEIDPLAYKNGTKHTWCFVDCTSAPVTLPLKIYDPVNQLFPIYVTSPKRSRWDQLHKLRIPAVIIMNPWTLEELEKASKLYPERSLDYVHEVFHHSGPIARLCFDYDSDTLQEYHESRTNWINNSTLRSLGALISNTRSLSMDDVSHKVCLITRSKLTPNNMRKYDINPITALVHQELRARIREFKDEEVMDLLEKVSRVPGDAGMMGPIFERHCQGVFARSIELNARPMFRSVAPQSCWHADFGDFTNHPLLQKAAAVHLTNPMLSLQITPGATHVYGTKENLTIKEDIYYVPEAGNAAAIDAFILHAGALYLLQFTIGSNHDIKSGLEETLRRFSGLPDRGKWYFIFVIPNKLTSFSCPHSKTAFLEDHVPYVAQVAVKRETLY